jgi:hypothetical protein
LQTFVTVANNEKQSIDSVYFNTFPAILFSQVLT